MLPVLRESIATYCIPRKGVLSLWITVVLTRQMDPYPVYRQCEFASDIQVVTNMDGPGFRRCARLRPRILFQGLHSLPQEPSAAVFVTARCAISALQRPVPASTFTGSHVGLRVSLCDPRPVVWFLRRGTSRSEPWPKQREWWPANYGDIAGTMRWALSMTGAGVVYWNLIFYGKAAQGIPGYAR